MSKFREGWQSFTDGLNKRNIREYWHQVWGHAWETWWGAGVIGSICTALTLYYSPSRWILGWVFAWAFLVAGYYTWRPYHLRSIKKIKLLSSRMTYAPTNALSHERKFAQVLVGCATEAPLEDCRGQLLKAWKWSTYHEKWEPTALDEVLDLLWSKVDETSITLNPGADRQLDIFFVQHNTWQLTPWSESGSIALLCSPGGVFKFDLMVWAKECKAEFVSIKATVGNKWDEIELESLPYENKSRT
jgi:hypothetical protein